jgi:hypothetical protein
MDEALKDVCRGQAFHLTLLLSLSVLQQIMAADNDIAI